MKYLVALLFCATLLNGGMLVAVMQSDEPQEMFNREGREGRLFGGRGRDKDPHCPPGGECPPGDGGGRGKTPPVGEGAPDFKPKPPEEPDTAPPAPDDDDEPSSPPVVTLPPVGADTTAAVEALKVQINVMQQTATTVIGGMNNELDALKKQLAETTALANKPFWIRVVDPRGKYTTDAKAVRLGEQIDLKLDPIASGGG